MIYADSSKLLDGAICGYQGQILGTLLAVAGAPATSDVQGSHAVPADKVLAGQTIAAAGTYYFFIPGAGASSVDVTLRASANAANIDQTNTKVYRTLSDFVTEKMNAAGASAGVGFAAVFANGVQQTASVSGLRGERGVLLKLVLTGAVTFDQADFSAL